MKIGGMYAKENLCIFLFSRFFLLTLQILCVEVYEYI